MIAVSLAAVLLSSALIMGVMYYTSYAQVKKEVAVQAAYVAAAVEEEGISYVERVGVRQDIGRITWISADGDVIYDNRDDETRMENHAERPEFKQAMAAGAGESVRLSLIHILVKDGQVHEFVNVGDIDVRIIVVEAGEPIESENIRREK